MFLREKNTKTKGEQRFQHSGFNPRMSMSDDHLDVMVLIAILLLVVSSKMTVSLTIMHTMLTKWFDKKNTVHYTLAL